MGLGLSIMRLILYILGQRKWLRRVINQVDSACLIGVALPGCLLEELLYSMLFETYMVGDGAYYILRHAYVLCMNLV